MVDVPVVGNSSYRPLCIQIRIKVKHQIILTTNGFHWN